MIRRGAVILGGVNPGHPNRVRDWKILRSGWYNSQLIEVDLPDMSASTIHGPNLVVFTSLESATPEQLQAIVNFAADPAHLLLFMHESAIFPRIRTDVCALIGGRFRFHAPYGAVNVRCLPHKLTEGIPTSFMVFDERYEFDSWPSPRAPWVTILEEKSSGYPLAWDSQAKNSAQIIYVALGHNIPELAANTAWQRLMANIEEILL